MLSIGHSSHSNNYSMDSSHLESVGHTKDLGITIDKHLKFHQCCTLTISKARFDFFGVRSINSWNNLPYDLVNASSLSIYDFR